MIPRHDEKDLHETREKHLIISSKQNMIDRRDILSECWHRLPKSIKYTLILIMNWWHPQRKKASRIRRTASWIQKHSVNELIFCPSGEVFERDETGAEFLVPVNLARFFKVGASSNFEDVETQLLLKRLKPGDVMFDVGANVGISSIRIARAIPDIGIYAFEPVAVNLQALRINVIRNQLEKSIHILELAVGETDGFAKIPSEYGTGNFIILPLTERFAYGSLETIEMISIDSFMDKSDIKSVAVIKCDVEGYELNVLKGAQKCLEQMRPVVLLELFERWTTRFGYHPEVVFQMMKDLNYKWYRITAKGEMLPGSDNLRNDLNEGHNFYFFPAEHGAVEIV